MFARLFVGLSAVASAIHLNKDASGSTNTAIAKAIAAAPAAKAQFNLANSLAALAHQKQAPGDKWPVDEEGYEKDWGTEHRSEPYPESSVGKQGHPDFGNTVKKEIEVAVNGYGVWFWVGVIGLLSLVFAGVFMYMKKGMGK